MTTTDNTRRAVDTPTVAIAVTVRLTRKNKHAFHTKFFGIRVRVREIDVYPYRVVLFGTRRWWNPRLPWRESSTLFTRPQTDNSLCRNYPEVTDNVLLLIEAVREDEIEKHFTNVMGSNVTEGEIRSYYRLPTDS